MNNLECLLALGSESFAPPAGATELAKELSELLNLKNGFWAFEYALEVFPSTTTKECRGLLEWNEPRLWKEGYEELAPGGLCFGQDVFGGQFVYSDAVYTFDPETGSMEVIGAGLEDWAGLLLKDYNGLTGHSIARQWQSRYGALPARHRLVPIVPFVLGGAFSVDNLVAMESVEAMRLRATLARQLRDLPDGAEVEYKVVD